jgi:hypothetical protein
VVTKFFISSSVIAILSKDPLFNPQTPIPGFTEVIPGLNLISASTLTGAQFTGATTGADQLGGLSASQFLRSDISQTTSYAFGAAGGLTVGSDLTFNSTSPTVSVIGQTTLNKNIRFDINRSGVTTAALTVTASTNTVTVGNALSVTGPAVVSGILTTGTVLPSGNVTVNIGSATARYANVFAQFFVGQAVTSQYADLAERFEADIEYTPGTVVQLGGAKEITAAQDELTEDVFGVISTRAGFLMNGEAGDNVSHPPVAMSGRVPVRVIGKITRGDRLVSAGAGLARAAVKGEYTAFNVIGRSLEDKHSSEEGTVEAIVKLNS